jgi:hypothetical protein
MVCAISALKKMFGFIIQLQKSGSLKCIFIFISAFVAKISVFVLPTQVFQALACNLLHYYPTYRKNKLWQRQKVRLFGFKTQLQANCSFIFKFFMFLHRRRSCTLPRFCYGYLYCSFLENYLTKYFWQKPIKLCLSYFYVSKKNDILAKFARKRRISNIFLPKIFRKLLISNTFLPKFSRKLLISNTFLPKFSRKLRISNTFLRWSRQEMSTKRASTCWKQWNSCKYVFTSWRVSWNRPEERAEAFNIL